jgi:hypothetical protein
MSIAVKDPLKLSPDFSAMQREELQVYKAICPSSDTVYNASTAGLLVFEMPLGDKGCEVLGIGYRIITAFDGMPRWQIGVSSDVDAFCTLTGGNMNSSGISQFVGMAEQFMASDFGSATDAFQILATIDDGGGSAGEIELSVYFRPSVGQHYNVRP